MRERDDRTEGLFSYVRLEQRVPTHHPLRTIRQLVDETLSVLNCSEAAKLDRFWLESSAPIPRL